MGFDRQFYVNTEEGFTSVWEDRSEENGQIVFTRKYSVKEDGEYYFQYYSEPYRKVEILSPTPSYTPIIHGKDDEVKLHLVSGDNIITLRAEGECKLYSRLFTSDSQLVWDGIITENMDSQLALDDIITENMDYGSEAEIEREVDTIGFTPALGAKIKGFGRFGFSKGDGVLDYSMPAFGILTRPFVSGHPKYKRHNMWSFSLLPDGEEERGASMRVYKPSSDESITVDWTHTSWERRLSSGNFIRFDYSTLTPSLLIETDLDYIRFSRLSSIGSYTSATLPLSSGFVTKTPSDGILYSRERDGELTKSFVILSRQNSFPETPILLSLPRSPESIISDRDSVRIKFDGALGYCLLTFPYGIELLGTEDLTEEFYNRTVKLAMDLHRAAITRPVSCEEYYKIEGEEVEIIDKFSYKIFEDTLSTPTLYLAPLPPPLSLAAEQVEGIKLDPRQKSLSFPTKYGPLDCVKNSMYSYYTIPIPEYREPLSFSSKSKELYTKFLHSDFDEYMKYHTDVDEIPNPGNYSFVFQYALVAKLFAYLKDEDRQRLEEEMKKGIRIITDPEYKYVGPRGRRCLSWYERRDPYTGIAFYSTYLHITGISGFHHCDREVIENAEKVFIEVDWGNAMSLYGAWLGALLSGSLDELDKGFGVIRRAFDYYLVNMDFACMCSGYAENGTMWNDGTSYGGYLGFINIADALGKTDELELGLYAYAKMCCMRQGMFLSSQKYFYKYLGVEPWYITKFFQEETDGSYSFNSYPTDMVKGGYRREGLYNLTTEGHYKEAFRMYARFLPDEVDKLLSAVESSLDVPIVGLTDWEVKYHSDRNGILSEQETYTYLCLNLLIGRIGREEMYGMINEAADNKRISREILGHYQLSHRRVPREFTRVSLLSELDSLNEPRLTAWRGLRITNAAYPSLTVSRVCEGAWLEVYSENPPRATLADSFVEFERVRTNIYRAKITTQGELVFATSESEGV